MIEFKKGYKLSRDYKRLKLLLDKGYEVVCFADYDWHDGTFSRDICIGRFIEASNKEYNHYSISCRGIAYVDCYPAWYSDQRLTDEEIFIKHAEHANIEFLDIDETQTDTEENKA